MRHIAVAAVVAVLVVGGEARAQQTPEQQKCINLLNKGMAKVASTAGKVARKCAATYAKDPAALPSPDTCAYNNAPKVVAARDKLVADATTVCAGGGVPTIGPTNSALAGSYGQGTGAVQVRTIVQGDTGSLLSDLVECTDAPEGAGCKCQDALIGASNKVLATWMKLFNTCKKAGLKKGTITTNLELAACINNQTLLDPKGKGAKAVAKLNKVITAKCSAPVTNPLPNGQCAGMSGTALGECINEWARCNFCDNLRGVDPIGPFINCDTFDDGQPNNSCYDIFD